MGEVSDEALTARLGALLAGHDPVPAAVLAAAREGLRWHDPDAELARLVADSHGAEAGAAPAGVRGGAARLLTFEAGPLVIEVEATATTGGRLRLVGQFVPPEPASVRAEQPAGSVTVPADALGRFTIPELVPGPTRLACLRPGAADVRTEWTVL